MTRKTMALLAGILLAGGSALGAMWWSRRHRARTASNDSALLADYALLAEGII
jgi:hypothetical protein